MIPNVDEIQMKKELNLKHLGGIKPEAPWIKRCGLGIKFTDEIQESDFQIESDSNKNTNQTHQHNSSSKNDSPVQKRVFSEQIIHHTSKSIEDTFNLAHEQYQNNDFDLEIDPNKASIIEDSRLD